MNLEAKKIGSHEELERMQICNFVKEGLQDVYNNRLIEFDTAFDELEARYHADE